MAGQSHYTSLPCILSHTSPVTVLAEFTPASRSSHTAFAIPQTEHFPTSAVTRVQRETSTAPGSGTEAVCSAFTASLKHVRQIRLASCRSLGRARRSLVYFSIYLEPFFPQDQHGVFGSGDLEFFVINGPDGPGQVLVFSRGW